MKKAMKIKVINRSAYALPQYETAGAAGMDVRADIRESIVLGPLERTLVPTGLYVEIPDGYEIQVRPRSGLAARHGISLVNSPGTIDPDYRGEIKAILVNLSDEPFEIKPGERIAQLVVARFERAEWESVETLGETAEARAAWDRPDEGDRLFASQKNVAGNPFLIKPVPGEPKRFRRYRSYRSSVWQHLRSM